MSDPSVEDEMRSEMRQFSAAMRAAMAQHAQAGNWLERRKARKQISRLIRDEQREQDQLRRDQLASTNQAVGRYRVYANTVAQRANDPSVDHNRRAADAAGLREQRDRLAARFVTNGHLTPVERGIALDGLDAATVFPEFETGNLFTRASQVKGLEALRYRALVAREATTARERSGRGADQQRATTPQPIEQSPREQVEDVLLAQARARLERIAAAPPQPNRDRVRAGRTGRASAIPRRADEQQRQRTSPEPARIADPAVAERDSLQSRLHLSIEHNGELTDRNADLTRRLTATTAQRDQRDAQLRAALAERDRLRAERDEAVRKVAERTPPAQRYGSPERQAEQARDAARNGHSTGQNSTATGRQGRDQQSQGHTRNARIDAEAARDTQYDAEQAAKGATDTVRPSRQRAGQRQSEKDAQEFEDYLGHVVGEEAESEARRDPAPTPNTAAVDRTEQKQAGWGRGFAEVAADFGSGRNGHHHDHDDHGRDRDREH